MWVHFPLKGAQGGLPRGGANGTSTVVFDSTLEDDDPASQRCCPGEPAHSPSSSPLVTAKIDNVAGIDYSLLTPPTVTAETLDVQLKVRLTLENHIPSLQGLPIII